MRIPIPVSVLQTIPLSVLLGLTSLLPYTSAQWLYPPNIPEGKSLSDYTSGADPIISDYYEYDIIVGGFRTPKPSFTISRCAKKGRTEPIYPSTVTFNSSDGHLAADGTWQYMDSHSNGPWSNEYPAGKHPWITPVWHLVGNETTGTICWWELYSVSEEKIHCHPTQGRDCESPYTRAVTVLGNDTENYFATVPFTVHAGLREGGRNYTWNSGDHTASRTTLVFSNMPTGNAAVGLRAAFSYTGAGVEGAWAAPMKTNSISLKAAYAIPLPPPPRPHFPDGAVVEEVLQTVNHGSQIRRFTVVPASPIGHTISQLPRLRRIIWRRRKHNHEYNVRRIYRPSQREAVLIQTRGQSVYSCEDMCTRCQSGCGPFTTCVVAKASGEESPRSGACANCVWRSFPRECSHRQAMNGDTEGTDEEWQYVSGDDDEEDDEGEEEEPFLPRPSRSSRSRGITSRTRSSKRDLKRNSRTTRGETPKPKLLTTPRAKILPCPAVVIPSPSKRNTATPAGQKYFKIPPGLSPNTAEDIHRAIDELNVVRAKLFSRLELLEAVQAVDWE
ncbi:hypothetical protein BDDG_11700 [Blastomyces dermatitidis ATCC 18188]|uniref:Uncharacterized protein n=1 Tax=Ajellomyces dermatitidis (strain ATCC 18188 / CBS 674.68) TaxID=653446 RepID=A0A0J9EKT2_AJEDA|nr:hypothetical protein BDDG_11700 [Blastomyces dermatitidis ATCC 18188]